MTFTKGYMVDGVFFPEGSTVEIITITGEKVVGEIKSAAKKKFLIKVDGIVRVLEVYEVHSITLAEGEDEE